MFSIDGGTASGTSSFSSNFSKAWPIILYQLKTHDAWENLLEYEVKFVG